MNESASISVEFSDRTMSVRFALDPKIEYSPRSIARIREALPIHGRGIKRGATITFPSSVEVPPEGKVKEFKAGDLSIHPGSGNFAIHLEDTPNELGHNLIGSLEGDLSELDKFRLSVNIAMT